MEQNYEVDKLDLAILARLMGDSRISYQDIAKELIVSGGTIHVRINKMKEAGIIRGSKLLVDYAKLGMEVMAFIGIKLSNAGDYKKVLKRLQKFSEVIEIHYTTGPYSLFIKILVKNIREMHLFLAEKLQSLEEIQSTETLICLDTPVLRDVFFEEKKEEK
ncbi:MAG: Lrp/AsnC ligand binding domain-containing protein [Oligoflexia bacterium]|nr:Lrp/AsnC ligand binding domain-containing protein [Oligoflexia bacterium]MBF0366192.1 Lrp/AsnC ligand binding domain-containing protein [Oligoflexia bacterium]